MGLTLLALGLTLAHLGGPGSLRQQVLPQRNDDLAARAQKWTRAGNWETSEAVHESVRGSRVAAAISVADNDDLQVQARGVELDAAGHCNDRAGAGPWTPMETTFRGGEFRVAVADLGRRYGCAQIRMRTSDDARVGNLQWELVEPRYPNAGRDSRGLSAAKPAPKRDIAPELQTIGVMTREEWGARPTQCSAPEADWYRMAIHHTAGPQTANDSVVERLQGTQAFAMDSGTFCDIPYQMLVGFDGSLYEGRSLDLQSGATGGGNNPGNLAVSFIGCYHSIDPECVGGVGHKPTPEMMQQGQLLVQTLVRLHDIATDDDNIRGHQQWPGNATACPGDRMVPRLGELRADLTWFAGDEQDRSWDDAGFELEVGGEEEVWVELENVGGLTWMPGVTFLAPTGPRDGDSPLAHSSWPRANRAATVDAPVEPGEIGRFTFTISTSSEDDIVQTFGLVHEEITWFADAPWGGGPNDESIELAVRGVPSAGSSDGDSDSDGDGDGDGDSEPGGTSGTDSDGFDTQALPSASGGDDGCGCSTPSTPSGVGALWLLVAAGLFRRRQS